MLKNISPRYTPFSQPTGVNLKIIHTSEPPVSVLGRFLVRQTDRMKKNNNFSLDMLVTFKSLRIVVYDREYSHFRIIIVVLGLFLSDYSPFHSYKFSSLRVAIKLYKQFITIQSLFSIQTQSSFLNTYNRFSLRRWFEHSVCA